MKCALVLTKQQLAIVGGRVRYIPRRELRHYRAVVRGGRLVLASDHRALVEAGAASE